MRPFAIGIWLLVNITIISVIMGVSIFLSPQSAFPAAWPADAGEEIGDALPADYDPSGIVWHDRLGMLLMVSDDGHVCQIDQNGGNFIPWDAAGDLEGIAIADSSTNYVYLGIENPDSIVEFDLFTGQVTGKNWLLTDWMTGPVNSGLEALTFVPNGHHPYAESSSGGLFYAGLQNDGKIYVFNVNLFVSGEVSYVDTITPVNGLTDISDLYYSSDTNMLYALFDTANLLLEMETDGYVISSFDVPGNDQEGVTLIPSCPVEETSIVIAEDIGPELWRYDGYPVSCGGDDPSPGPTETVTPPPISTVTPTLMPTPQPTYTAAPPGQGVFTVEVSSNTVDTGDLFTLGISLGEDIEQSFDFYLLADTPYGVYAIFLNGAYQYGIYRRYQAIPGYKASYSAEIWSNTRVPSGISGAFTFYAVAVEAGRVPPVERPWQLTEELPYVLALASETVVVHALTPPVNSVGRSGAYYLPPRFEGRALPLLFLFHGTGGDGAGILSLFKDLARSRGFIIVAPDSRISSDGQYTWEIASAGEKTEDYEFALAWIEYVRSLPGVAIDESHVMAAGFSGGGSSAPYLATSEPLFTAFASLHGGAYSYTIGPNNISGWLSTGDGDQVRTPRMVSGYTAALRALGFNIDFRIYGGGHTLSSEERSELVAWWLAG